MISEKLSGIYTKLEDKYFDALDFLDAKGIPVYKFSDFFENRGIPSFVVLIAILLMIIVLVTVAFTYKGPDVSELTLSLRDANGESITNADLVIIDSGGNTLFEGKASDGDTIKLSRALYNGEEVTITAQRDGYAQTYITFTIGTEDNVPRLSFDAGFDGVNAKVRVIDKETKTIIQNATIIASANNLTYKFDADTNGFYAKAGVPSGVSVLLKVNAEGYNEYSQTITFNEGQVREVQMEPSNASFVGKATVAIDVSDPADKLVDLAKVVVTNKNDETILLSGYTQGGRLTGLVQAGIPLRITVEKEGFLSYNSDIEGGGITIRKSEAQISVKLKLGGQNMRVLVSDAQSGFGIDGATVQIFTSDGVLVDAETTSVNGVDFNGLDPKETLYFTAQKEGYLPSRQIVKVSTTEEVKILLTRVAATNSARIDIYSIDSSAKPINGVKVMVYELTDGNKLPYGMPIVETGFAGYANVTVANGKTYELYGFTEVLEATALAEIKVGDVDKKVYLKMEKKPNIVEIHFVDVLGKDVSASATISGLDGTLLFDGELALGSAFFDAQQKSIVEVKVTRADGNTFTENVTLAGKDYAEVVVYEKGSAALAPSIEFVGLENEQGDTVAGMTPGAFYWAKFVVAFPRAAATGGVHFRAGSDNIAFAESDKVGVYDLSFQGSTVAYSQSYTPTPSPGNEAVDRANSGAQGEKNKWVEGTLSAPVGTYTIKVKLRTEDFTPGKIQLQYRAWAIASGDYYRTPADTVLSNSAYTSEKSGLYATTATQDFVLYESLPECAENICLTASFIDSDEQYYQQAGFEALKEKEYAIEVELTAKDADYVQLVATTDSNIDFSSTQTGNFGFAVDRTHTSNLKKTASAAVSLSKEGKQKIRFYFTPNASGNASITLTATGKSSVEKEVLFNVVEEKTLLVELSESQVIPGRNFTVKVADSGLKGVENALVKIVDKEGKVVKSISGDGTDGKGKNGFYRVENNLSPGLYTVEVSAQKFLSQAVPLLITIQNLLSFPDALEAKIQTGQKSIVLSNTLENNSDFSIQDITIQTDSKEIQTAGIGQSVYTDTSGKFKIRTNVPTAMGKNQKQPVQLTVEYLGAVDESVDETATITISGLVEGKFLTKVVSTLHMTYNLKLDPACLKLDPAMLTLNVLGSANATDTQTIEITSACDQQVTLAFAKNKVKEKTKRSFIDIKADDIDIAPGETKNITVTATNLVDRGSARAENFGFDIVYDTNYIKKTVSVNVQTINPIYALNYPAQITLWMAQPNISEKASAAQPIFVTNASSFPVDNISFAVNNNYFSGSNMKVSVEPNGVVSLLPGQSITPPKIVFAQTNSKITEPVTSQIVITGKMGNLNNRAGQNDRYNYYSNYYDNASNSAYGSNSIYNGSAYGNSAYGNSAYNRSSYNSPYSNSSNYLSNASPLNYYTSGSSSYYNSGSQVLGVIQVTVFYSGYNCLEARVSSDGDSFFFPTQGGQIGKVISIVNTCAEPIRIVGASPAAEAKMPITFGLPKISSSILLSLPPISVSPGETAKVPLSIMTAVPNVKRTNYQIVVNGVSEVSQTPINSKPLSINIYSGLDTSAEHVKANKVNVQVCSPTGGQPTKEEVSMPKTTSSNCAEGYCDAKDAAAYLSQKILDTIAKARSAGYTQKNNSSAFSCQNTEGACTFEEIGMQPTEVDLFLQSDAVGGELLERTINNNQMEGTNTTPFRETLASNGFLVIPETVDFGVLKPRILSGYDRTIFLDRDIAGCGYYRLQISGVFRAGAEGLETMTPVISVKASLINGKPRLETNECRIGINNIVNFNPVDKGLSGNNSQGTWVTTVDSDQQLNEIAKGIAKARFGSDTRVSSGSGNKIKVVRGALVGSVAQMCVSGNDRKTITVTIDNSAASSTSAKDTFNASIISMVSNALNGSFGENCLVKSGDNYLCVNLSDFGNSAARKLSVVSDKIQFSANKESCISGTVYSNYPENLNFDITPNPNNTKDFIGVKKITISADDSRSGPVASLTANKATANATSATTLPSPSIATPLPGTTKQTQAVNPQATDASLALAGPLTKGTIYSYEVMGGNVAPVEVSQTITLKKNPTSKDYKYYRNIKICASPSTENSVGAAPETAYVAANGVQFQVALVNLLGGESNAATKDASQIITIQTGTLHPDDLVKLLCTKQFDKTGKENPYYFTVAWQKDAENPDAITFGDYVESLKRLGAADSCVISTDQSGYRGTEVAEKERTSGLNTAILQYGIGCSMVSAACNAAITTGVGVPMGILTDCGIPLITQYKTEISESSKLVANVYDFLAKLLKPLPFGIGQAAYDLLKTKEEPPHQKSYWVAGLEGALTGAARARLPSVWTRAMSGFPEPSISERFFGNGESAYLNQQAKDRAVQYAKLFRKSLESSVADKTVLDSKVLQKLEDSIAADGEKMLKEKLNTAWKETYARKTKLRQAFWSTDVYANGAPVNDLQKVLGEGVEGFGEVTTKAFEKKVNGVSIAKQLFGTDEVALIKSKLIPGSALEHLLGKMETVPQQVIANSIKKQLNLVADGGKIKKLTAAELKKITTNILDTAEVDLKNAFNVPASAGTVYTDRVALQQSMENLVLKGGTVDDFVNAVNKSIASNLVDSVTFTPAAGGAATTVKLVSRLDDAGIAKINEELQKMGAADVKKIKLKPEPSKVKAIAKTMGKSILCGVLANEAGAAAFNDAIQTTDKEIRASSIKLVKNDYVLQRGKTYGLIIDKFSPGNPQMVSFFEVTPANSAEMDATIAKDSKRMVPSLATADGKSPEERGLTVWPIKASLITAKEVMKRYKYPYDETVQSRHLDLLKSKEFQKIIFNYTGEKTIDNKNNNHRITTDEGLAIAIALFGNTQGEYNTQQIDNESKELNGWLKDKLTQAVAAGAEKGMTKQIAKQLFPKITDKEAQALVDMRAIWDKISLELSPGVALTPAPVQ